MNQLAFNQSQHPSSFSSTTPTAGSPGQYYYGSQQQQPQKQNQAFAYPGQQSQGQYQDGVNSRGLMQQPYAGSPDQQYHTSTASHSHSIAAHAQPDIRKARPTASPTPHLPPNAPIHPASNSTTPPTQYPMAAPPLPQSQSPPTSQTQQQPNSPPQSPTTTTRESERLTLLLSINQSILSEIHRLHSLGQGGAQNQLQAAQFAAAGQSDKLASEDYISLLRRMQGNFAYLQPRMPGQQQQPGKVPPAGPVFMTCPPCMPELREKYQRLRELFPNWVGQDARYAASAGGGGGGGGSPVVQQGQQQGVNGSGGVMGVGQRSGSTS